MKKFNTQPVLTLFLLAIGTLSAWAQYKVMQVHCDGSVVYEVNISQVDSITFKDGNGKPIDPILIAQGFFHTKIGFPTNQGANMIVATQTEWEALLPEFQQRGTEISMETAIDFSEYRIIAIFDKKKGGPSTVDVVDVSEYADRIVVTTDNLRHDLMAVESQAFCVVKIPVSTKQVVFQHVPSPNL